MSLQKNFNHQITRSTLLVIFMVINVFWSNLPPLFMVRKYYFIRKILLKFYGKYIPVNLIGENV